MPQNVSASVHQRLLNIAKQTERPFNELLQYYAMERFLYRLSQSEQANSFTLKGALLFRIWDTPDSRATRDIDVLGFTDNTPENLAGLVHQIASTEVPDDGLSFDPASISAQRTKEDADYEGVRIRFLGYLGKARIQMQMDVGFGDVVHPAAKSAQYPTLLDYPAPCLRIYPPETVVAEKVQTMVHLGPLNSRMKDYYDVWRMSRQFDFKANELGLALKGTFANRATDLIDFDALLIELLEAEQFQAQWAAFLKKALVEGPERFAAALSALGDFLSTVFSALTSGRIPSGEWIAPGPWRK